MTLTSLGWDEFFAIPFHPFSSDGFLPARGALEHKHVFELLSSDREYTCNASRPTPGFTGLKTGLSGLVRARKSFARVDAPRAS